MVKPLVGIGIKFFLINDNVRKFIIKKSNYFFQKRKPPSFFANLHRTLQTLLGFFRQGDNSQNANNNEMLSRIQRLLALHGMDTSDLIMQVRFSFMS